MCVYVGVWGVLSVGGCVSVWVMGVRGHVPIESIIYVGVCVKVCVCGCVCM